MKGSWNIVIGVGALLSATVGGAFGWWSVRKERVWMASAREAEMKIDPAVVDGGRYADLEELWRRFDAGEEFDVWALRTLGYYYKNLKRSNPAEKTRIFRIFKRLAEEGDDSSMCEVAYLYLSGFGTATNETESTVWYGKAHAATNYFGTFGLADAYRHGRGVAVDVPRAVELYKEAERHGVGGAACKLGEIYEQGLLGKPDVAEARRWHRKSVKAARNEFGHREMSEAALKRLEKKTSQGR